MSNLGVKGTSLVLATVFLFSSLYLPASARDLPSVESSYWPSQYDKYFRKYSKRYFGANFDWQWFKAQAIAESNLNPDATSHVGAIGLMQIMPTTYLEIQDANPHFQKLTEPRWNIAAGIYYDRMLFRKWQTGLAEQERLLLTFASYNAGLGGIRRAYKRTPQPIIAWSDVAPNAPRETRGYVQRIKKLKKRESRVISEGSKGIWSRLAANREEASQASP